MNKKNTFFALFFVFTSLCMYGQQSTVTGKITAPDGTTLPAATVVIKGSIEGTVADYDGNYSIQADAQDTLVFSYIGFATVDYAVNSRLCR